jgi:hypothetical protein
VDIYCVIPLRGSEHTLSMPVQSAASDQTHFIPPRRLWFGATGAAVAWALQGFTCFQIAVQACANGTGSWGPLSGLGVRLLLGVVTLAFLIVAGAAGVISYRSWRTVTESRELMQAEGHDWQAYVALAGVFASVTCSVGLIWAGIPPIFFEVCNTIR